MQEKRQNTSRGQANENQLSEHREGERENERIEFVYTEKGTQQQKASRWISSSLSEAVYVSSAIMWYSPKMCSSILFCTISILLALLAEHLGFCVSSFNYIMCFVGVCAGSRARAPTPDRAPNTAKPTEPSRKIRRLQILAYMDKCTRYWPTTQWHAVQMRATESRQNVNEM